MTGQLGALLGLLQLLLSLAELGQVQGGDLLSLLDLLLVSLDLLLEFVGQFGHPVLVLAVLILLELELLYATLSTLERLVSFLGPGLGCAQLHLQLPDLHLQLGHGSLATLHGSSLSIDKPGLELAKLRVQSPLGTGLSIDMVLLAPQLIGKAGGVNLSRDWSSMSGSNGLHYSV